MKINVKVALAFVGLGIFVVYPLTNPPPYLFYLLILVFTDVLVVIGLNLLVGYGGIFHISPAIFIGVGGYAAGWLSVNARLNPFITIGVGGAVAVVASLMFSLVSTRVKGFYMAVYSVIFTLLLGVLVIQPEPAIIYLTGGPFGISKIPDITLAGVSFRDFAGMPYYYLALGILAVAFVLVYRLVGSRYGLALRSLRDGEMYSSTLGVDALRIKVYIFAISSFMMGISGGLTGHFLGAFGQSIFSFRELLHFNFEMVVGGLGTFVGPIIGAITINLLNESLAYWGAWLLLAKGLIVVLFLLYMPKGLMGKIEEKIASRKK
ncbi:MAG: branched-chain amino acid ABC transporter permease [Candidatus Bathyarchaeia archaeon]